MNDLRYDRLRRTRTFRDGGHEAWTRARIGVIGAGVLGGPLAVAIARSGARVVVFDPQDGAPENLGTQLVAAGEPKAETVAAACNAMREGSAEAVISDIRHAGAGLLRGLSVLCDCTDDATLAFFLTEISNGLDVPLLRLAVDGSGENEMGRVRCSAGGAGHACQLCGYDAADLARSFPRTPCPGAPADLPPPTLAGGALSMTITGVALLQTQRLVTGNDADLVLDREIRIDWSRFEVQALALERSAKCLSGHRRWRLVDVAARAEECTLDDLFALCRDLLGDADATTLEPHGHALCVEARCPCGASVRRAGTIFAAPPPCPRCNTPLFWRRDGALVRLTQREAAALGVAATPLLDLGLPRHGAVLKARAPRRAPVHLVLPAARRTS